MSEYEKTTTPGMVIDKASGAVLNTDMGAYAAIKKAREEKRKQQDVYERVSKLEEQVKIMMELLMKREPQDNRE